MSAALPPAGEHIPAAPGARPGRPLLANTLHAIAGNAVYHACQLGAIVLLAKFGSPQIQGQYFLALAVATPVVLLFGLELRGAFVADAGGQFPPGAYESLRRRLMLPAGLLLAAFLAWRALHEPRPGGLLILAAVIAGRILWALSEVGWGSFQRRERLDLLAVSLSLRGLALLLPCAALLPLAAWLAGRGALAPARIPDVAAAALLLATLGTAAVLLLYDRPRVRAGGYGALCRDPAVLAALARQTLPLGIVALVINLCDTAPRLLIERMPDGTAQLGYFGALAHITLVGNLVVLQAATAAANRLAVYYRRDLGAFLRLGAGLGGVALLVAGVVLAAALLFGRWILSVLYTPEYARFEAAFHIVVAANGLALLTHVLGTATTQMRLFRIQVPAQLLTLACTLLAAVRLIPPDPVRGAAETALVRALVQLVLYAGCVAGGIALRRRILHGR